MRTLAINNWFRSDRGQTQEEERLLELFSNRVALKKEFEQLQIERRQLTEALEEANEASRRQQLKLEYLERLLTDGNTAAGTMLFYHLRGLWRRCSRRLQSMASDMSARIAGRRQLLATENWRKEHAARVARVAQALANQEAEIVSTRQQIAAFEEEIEACRWFWQWLRRHRLRGEKGSLEEMLYHRINAHHDTTQEHATLSQEAAPIVSELSLADKRLINLHVLALAQCLHAHFDDYGLVSKANATMRKDVGTVDFGDEEQCKKTQATAEQAFIALVNLEQSSTFRSELMNQADLMAKTATYAGANELVPEPFLSEPVGCMVEAPVLVVSELFSTPACVMDEDIWSLSEAFIR